MIKFLLNDNQVSLSQDYNPNTTILNYLRNTKLCGTKEGCASGDCGACTVVVVEADSQFKQLYYRSINSCISLLGSLAGRQLITVEGLKDGQKLHPVQQAMVDLHGSQCGFCTPGFVMSLFALYKNKQFNSRQDVLEALAGNLCRCTGYRPIIDAALSLKNYSQADKFDTKTTLLKLKNLQINSKKNNTEESSSVGHYLPKNCDELAECLLNNPKAKLICGGTDLALEITQQYKNFPCFIYLGDVVGLNSITDTETELRIGAAVNLTKLLPLFQNIFLHFLSCCIDLLLLRFVIKLV